MKRHLLQILRQAIAANWTPAASSPVDAGVSDFPRGHAHSWLKARRQPRAFLQSRTNELKYIFRRFSDTLELTNGNYFPRFSLTAIIAHA